MKINVKIYLFLLLFSCSSEYNLISNQHQVIDVKNNIESVLNGNGIGSFYHKNEIIIVEPQFS